MKKLSFLPLAALAFTAACADVPTAVAPSGASFDHNNEVNGPTLVVGTYVKPGASTTYVNTHPRAGTRQGGSCRAESGAEDSNGPIWYNPEGHRTSASHCALPSGGGAGATITCTFSVNATFAAQAHDVTSGNQHLNFDVTKAVGYDAVNNPNPDLFVKYFANGQGENSNNTVGEGMLSFTATCTNGTTTQESGTLNLNGFDAIGSNLFSYDRTSNPPVGRLDVSNASVVVGANTYALTGLTWEYRSEVQ
jgi:hypothetical protein